ncbi:RagB/SusD family nutrient uptake outer membrane protein [Flavobacterium branchiicola]|uniref:RagB/SusD family nutrient uptake outer membrane protein n=1 Tax=Flavobacterium branchiicola TaxID=1114875 RepID=A0ABV9PE88_9FLAO|nr:RagB/SusD family nutrient uptake outer membrane protein [Flavobacterium branchiicola]MBS7253806.1 RagB/SusD family nutrient uptake outer membrane protein [Flavobacterium branchiicola]
MKNIKIAVSLLLVISLNSCDEFLSEIPDNRTQIDTPEKISELLVTAYPNKSYVLIGETMSDNVFDSETQSSDVDNRQSYNWEMQTQLGPDTEADFWNGSYEAIASANQALTAIEELGSPESLNPQKGEALLARAYNHFMLVSFWSNRYNPATAATDLGIPYITKPETELLVTYKRNSVKEVFDFIEKDITEGMKYITNNYKEPKYHFNVDAAKAFASRFYLVKGDWDKVLDYSKALGSKPTTLRDYVAFNAAPSAQKSLEYSKVEQPTNLLVAYPNSTARRGYQNRFYLADNRSDEILGAETNIWGKSWLIYTSSFYENNVIIPKFYEYFKYTNVTAGIGEAFTGVVLLSNDEFFLNRIEAHVMKNQFDEANAELQYLLGLRTAGFNATTDKITEANITAMYPAVADEYTPFYTLTPVQASYIKAIAEARRREFIQEGLRWFDVKRFNLVVEHVTKENGQPVKTNILTKDDKRRALQIPQRASDTGIEKNPR